MKHKLCTSNVNIHQNTEFRMLTLIVMHIVKQWFINPVWIFSVVDPGGQSGHGPQSEMFFLYPDSYIGSRSAVTI